jgi:HAD superfamily hydrolase (TIGR01509 family)
VAQAALLDVDGTLVDTNYHHALAWSRAFRRHGIVLPLWRLHRHVGMGGDKYVAALAGDDVERRLGDDLRDAWEEEFDRLIDECEPLAGARELVSALKDAGLTVVLASSSIDAHLEAFVDKLGVREVVDGWTNKDDVEASKPDPDLVRAGLEKAGTRDAVLLGDTPWDVEAARRAGIDTACVMTGGFSRAELEEAGAVAVYSSIDELLEGLAESPLAGAQSAARG